MSDNDIIINAEDRIRPSTTADTVAVKLPRLPRPRRAPKETTKREVRTEGRPDSKPPNKPNGKLRRRLPFPRFNFTALQKLSAAGIAMTTVIIGGAVIWHSGIIQNATRAAIAGLFQASAQAGFRVDRITISGRERTSMDQLSRALGAGYGSPILAMNLTEAKDRLEALPSVRIAAVERRLPDSVHIAIVERQPIAIWQDNGEHMLIDNTGKVIPGSIAGYEHLPLVVGDGAGLRADELFTMLASEPTLAPRVKAAVRVSNRRWNLMLDDTNDGLEVRLPEESAEAAWHRLAELERAQGLPAHQVRMVDLRLADRMILKTERASAPIDATRRKDNGA